MKKEFTLLDAVRIIIKMGDKPCKVCGSNGPVHHVIKDKELHDLITKKFKKETWLVIYIFMTQVYLPFIHSLIEELAEKDYELKAILEKHGRHNSGTSLEV